MKIHWIYKISAFVASIMTLSGFFAGWRQIHETPGLNAWALLFSSTLMTLLLLSLQGFWIYIDEKQKGTLRKRIGIFDNIYSALVAKGYIRVDLSKDSSHPCCGVETEKA